MNLPYFLRVSNPSFVTIFTAAGSGILNVRAFSVLEFLAELQQHLPDTFEQTSRFFGIYSSRSPAFAKASAGQAAALRKKNRYLSPRHISRMPQLNQVLNGRHSRLRSRCGVVFEMKRVFEINPLICPRCGTEMKIKVFITDSREISQITKNLGLPSATSPPPLLVSIPLAA